MNSRFARRVMSVIIAGSCGGHTYALIFSVMNGVTVVVESAIAMRRPRCVRTRHRHVPPDPQRQVRVHTG